MSKEQTRELLDFLKPFPPSTLEIPLWLRDFIWDLYPATNELIYDNYNALAIGWSPHIESRTGILQSGGRTEHVQRSLRFLLGLQAFRS